MLRNCILTYNVTLAGVGAPPAAAIGVEVAAAAAAPSSAAGSELAVQAHVTYLLAQVFHDLRAAVVVVQLCVHKVS